MTCDTHPSTPCPKCGGAVRFQSSSNPLMNLVKLRCTSCGKETSYFPAEETAVKRFYGEVKV